MVVLNHELSIHMYHETSISLNIICKTLPDCDLQIEGDQSISRKHATLHVAGTEKVGNMKGIFFTYSINKL